MTQGKSRVIGDNHARFCERLGVKFPEPTRRCRVTRNPTAEVFEREGEINNRAIRLTPVTPTSCDHGRMGEQHIAGNKNLPATCRTTGSRGHTSFTFSGGVGLPIEETFKGLQRASPLDFLACGPLYYILWLGESTG
jgi:hypothetical protein